MKKASLVLFVLLIALFNYKLARLFQDLILNIYPNLTHEISLSIPWFIIALIPVYFLKGSGLVLNTKEIRENKKAIIKYVTLIFLGLVIFTLIGITKYFHSVKYPLVFFLTIPIAEELVFRGFIYRTLEKMKFFPLLGSSALFALHHLQYYDYTLTRFALFQITYTFILGLLLGKLRQKSGSIYLPLFVHIVINFGSIRF